MLIWCSYCQQFLGEQPPFEQLAISHGICAACEPSALTLTKSALAHARRLRDIQSQLGEAGRRGDLQAAEQIIENAGKANVRGVDILVGVIAPLLYRIGEDWQCDNLTVAQEHRFTRFCEAIYQSVASNIARTMPAGPTPDGHVGTLLINAPGNRHTLAVRMLALWLERKGIRALPIVGPLTTEDLIALIDRIRPNTVLVSMALAEQAPGVIAIAARIAALPDDRRPRIIVGGYAVKLGLVAEIPGAVLMSDIGSLADVATEKSAPAG